MLNIFKKFSIFNKNTKSKTPSVNMLSIGTTLKGDIIINGDFRFDGKLIGSIDCSNGKLVLSSKSIVEGSIKCQEADIAGKVKGKIHSSGLVILKNTSEFDGDIFTHKLMIEIGANVTSNCHTKDESPLQKDEIIKS